MVVVGAGAGGLGLAVLAAQAGIDDVVVLERGDGVGGTWRINTYPGAECDVPSHLYSYSFALNPDWSKTFAGQAEILAYFERCADEAGVRDRIRTGAGVRSLRWGDDARRWLVTTEDGDELRARVVVSAVGTFNAGRPRPGRPRLVRRPGPALGPLGPRRRPGRAAGRRDRHRGQRHPDRAGHRRRGRPPRRVPAVGAVDHAAGRQALRRRGPGRLRRRRHGHAPPPPRHRAVLRGQHRLPCRRPAVRRLRALRPGPPRGERRRPGAARGAHPRLPDRVQARAPVGRLLPGPAARSRRPGHVADPRGGARRHRHRRRRAPPARRARAGHRLPRHRLPPRHRGRRPRRPPPARRLGRRAAPTSA